MLLLIIAKNTEASSASQLNPTIQLASQTNNTFQESLWQLYEDHLVLQMNPKSADLLQNSCIV